MTDILFRNVIKCMKYSDRQLRRYQVGAVDRKTVLPEMQMAIGKNMTNMDFWIVLMEDQIRRKLFSHIIYNRHNLDLIKMNYAYFEYIHKLLFSFLCK